MDIIILPRAKVGYFTHDKPWILISVNDLGEDPPIINPENLLDKLILNFLDTDIRDGTEFKKFHAQQILEFTGQYWEQADTLLVHCTAGRCRSPAIGAALAKIYFDNDGVYFKQYTPNMLVYRTLLETHWSS